MGVGIRLGDDLRFAFRQLARNRLFAATILLTVGLGVGLNTAMFSVIRAVLLRPDGYADPGRLVLIGRSATPVRYEEFLAGARSYTGVGAYLRGEEHFAYSAGGDPRVLTGARVSANFLDVLGVKPVIGRGFLPAEDQTGGPNVALISWRFWQRGFGGSANVLGKAITLSGVSYTIVGVLPARFLFPAEDTAVWVTRPAGWSGMAKESRPLSPILQIFGRLKPGVSRAAADAELSVLQGQYRGRHAGMLDAKAGEPEAVHVMRDAQVTAQAPKLWMLLGAVGLVLLIVCANVASLLLARATTRAKEFAVRAAIGAGRGQIIGQLLTESLLLAVVGGGLGVGLAWASVRAIRGMAALDLPRKTEIVVDGQVLLFAAGVSVFTGLVFGLAPALAASKPDLARVLKGSGEGATYTVASGHVRRGVLHGVLHDVLHHFLHGLRVFTGITPRNLLVVGQVALSTVLLIGAALLVESLGAVYRVDPGFEVRHLLTMHIAPSAVRYDTDLKRSLFYTELVERIEALPGVKSAAVTMTLPMTGWAGVPMAVAGRAELKLNERPIAVYQSVTPDYFKTLGIGLKRGRFLTAHDNAGAGPVAVIDEGLARKFWPAYPGGVNPVGERVLVGSHSKPTEIVGIVGDTRQEALEDGPEPGIYLAAAQKPPESAMVAVRVRGSASIDPMEMANAVRKAILGVDPDQPVTGVNSMEYVVDQAEGPLRVMMTLLAVFAGVASLVASIGLYGVIAYSVAQRTKEMGIRRALGAGRGDILSLVAGDGLRLAAGGVLVGLGGAFVLTRLLRGMLYGVSATDPKTYLGIAVLFLLVALLASYLPGAARGELWIRWRACGG